MPRTLATYSNVSAKRRTTTAVIHLSIVTLQCIPSRHAFTVPFPAEQGIAISTFEKSFHFDAGASLRECCYNEEDFTLHNRQTTLRYYFVNRRSKRGEMRACLYPAILPASSAHQLPLYQFLFYKPLTTQSLCLRILNSRFPLYPVSSMLSKGI
jgi:hypothetical protein